MLIKCQLIIQTYIYIYSYSCAILYLRTHQFLYPLEGLLAKIRIIPAINIHHFFLLVQSYEVWEKVKSIYRIEILTHWDCQWNPHRFQQHTWNTPSSVQPLTHRSASRTDLFPVLHRLSSLHRKWAKSVCRALFLQIPQCSPVPISMLGCWGSARRRWWRRCWIPRWLVGVSLGCDLRPWFVSDRRKHRSRSCGSSCLSGWRGSDGYLRLGNLWTSHRGACRIWRSGDVWTETCKLPMEQVLSCRRNRSKSEVWEKEEKATT